MIRLEQIRELNDKVQSTLEVIRVLRDENDLLRSKLEENETRVKELEVLVSSFRNDQDEIEEGITGILLQLDRLEEEFTAPPAPRSEEVRVVANTPSVEEEVSSTMETAEESSDSEASDEAVEEEEAVQADSTPSEAFLGFTPADEAVSSPVDTSSEPAPISSDQEAAVEGFIPGGNTPGSHPSPTYVPAAAGDAGEGTLPENSAEAPSPASGETELDIF